MIQQSLLDLGVCPALPPLLIALLEGNEGRPRSMWSALKRQRLGRGSTFNEARAEIQS